MTTPTGQRLEAWFRAHPQEVVDAQQLLEVLQAEVSRASIYRHLGRLVREGMLREVANPDGAGKSYIYPGPPTALRLHCRSCGAETALACPEITALGQHLAEAHDFAWDTDVIALSGYCKACQGKDLIYEKTHRHCTCTHHGAGADGLREGGA